MTDNATFEVSNTRPASQIYTTAASAAAESVDGTDAGIDATPNEILVGSYLGNQLLFVLRVVAVSYVSSFKLM